MDLPQQFEIKWLAEHFLPLHKSFCISFVQVYKSFDCVVVQESSERIRELNSQLDDAKRRRTELEHKLHEAQNEYSSLEATHRRVVERESVLQDQISDLQSQLNNHMDAHNQTKATLNEALDNVEQLKHQVFALESAIVEKDSKISDLVGEVKSLTSENEALQQVVLTTNRRIKVCLYYG